MEGQVHEDIDAIRADHFRCFRIADSEDIPPVSRLRAQCLGKTVGPHDTGVTKDLEALAIIFLEQWKQTAADNVLAEISRDQADAQPALWGPVIAMRTSEFPERLAMLLIPLASLREEGGAVVRGIETDRVGEVAMDVGGIRLKGDRAPVAFDSRAHSAHILIAISKVILGCRVVWIELHGAETGLERFVQLARFGQGHSEIALGLGIGRAEVRRPAGSSR